MSRNHEDGDRKESMGLRMKLLEEKLASVEQENFERSEAVRAKLTQLQEGLKTEEVSREILVERKAREFKTIESSVTLDINLERLQQKIAEERLLRALDSKCTLLAAELTAGSDVHGNGYTKEEEGKLVEMLEEERSRRALEDERIAQSIAGELGELHRLVETEKRAREEGTRAVISLIEKFSKRIQDEIAQEKKEREQTEETILRMLEGVSGRMGR